MSADASERWLALAAQFPIGSKTPVTTLTDGEAGTIVAAGQLRRAYWGDESVFVLIVMVDDDSATAHVWPATVEPGIENEQAVVVEETASPLYTRVALWPTKQTAVTYAVLDQCVAHFSGPTVNAVASLNVEAAPDGIRRGEARDTLGSGVSQAIDELFDAVAVLEAAPRYRPRVAPSPVRQKLPLPLAEVVRLLNTSQADAMTIMLGKRPLTDEEAEILAASAGISTDEVQATVLPLPENLARELQEPYLRPEIRARASDGDESTARTRLGYEAYALAARQTPGDTRHMWRQRIEAALLKGT